MDLGKIVFQVIYSECQLFLLHVISHVDKDRFKKKALVHLASLEGIERRQGKLKWKTKIVSHY